MRADGRVLVVLVDSLGPSQLEIAKQWMTWGTTSTSIEGELGFSSGALATLLTGRAPAEHGRMCLFEAHRGDGDGPLAPLSLLGLLPKLIHERGRLRRYLSKAFAAVRGMSGYFELHRVPPTAFKWLDVAERDDLFASPDILGNETFLETARRAGLSVQVTPWQVREEERWQQAFDQAKKTPADLTFMYVAELDGVQHREGSHGAIVEDTIGRIGAKVSKLREMIAADGSPLTTIVVGDHGMADIRHVIDPRPLSAKLDGIRHFVDSTMIRVWGSPTEIAYAGEVMKNAGVGTWLDRDALVARGAPVETGGSGGGLLVLNEGSLFAPSFVGGVVRGMHGYDRGTLSAKAGLLSDQPLSNVRSLRDVAGAVREGLGVAA
ncbi:MAG: alkaline phosphatase family protein [Polyangiaceae bacterium]